MHWLDPPRAGGYAQACELLSKLQAIDARAQITAQGRILAHLPLHPRLAHMLAQAREKHVESLGADLAALLSERDPMPQRESADMYERLELLELYRNRHIRTISQRGGDPTVVRRIDQVAQRLRQGPPQPLHQQEEALGSLLLAAFPERVAQKRADAAHRYQLASGRGVQLLPTDPLCGSAFLVAAQLDGGRQEGRVHLAAALDKKSIVTAHTHLLSQKNEVRWDRAQKRVMASACTMLGVLVVEERPLQDVSPEALTEALLAGIAEVGLEALPFTPRCRQLQARLHLLRRIQNRELWPNIDDTTLRDDLSWLVPYISGMRQLAQLQSLDLYSIFLSQLDWPQQQRLEQLAPETITVPSGSKIRLDYVSGERPILAVRLQEMFGQANTPAICNQQVPLLLHLLSPARRPIQVTEDLASFWQNGYPEVKKELKGRYPKHAWPDDPLKAQALRGVPKKRSTT